MVIDFGSMFKGHIATYLLLSLSDHAVLNRHDMLVRQYIANGYQIIDSYYSPKFEKINLEKLLYGINIPDKIV